MALPVLSALLCSFAYYRTGSAVLGKDCLGFFLAVEVVYCGSATVTIQRTIWLEIAVYCLAVQDSKN